MSCFLSNQLHCWLDIARTLNLETIMNFIPVDIFYLALVLESIQSISSRIVSNSLLMSATISRAACFASSLKYFCTYMEPTALARLPFAAPTHVRHLEKKE